MISLLLLSAIVIFPCALVFKTLWDFFRDPLRLRGYPSPSIWAALTPLWLMNQSFRERRSRAIYEQHKRLGDVVRIAPRHVSINDPRAIKDIYGHQAIDKVNKDVFYTHLKGEHWDIVQVPDRGEHTRKRKYLAHAFALKTVVSMEPVIHENASRLLQGIERHCDARKLDDTATINIRQWFNFFTLDVIADMAMGIKLGFCETGSDASWAETKGGNVYPLKSTIDTLQQGVRYSVTLAQGSSERWHKFLKSLLEINGYVKRLIRAQDADDFTNFSLHKVKTRIENGGPDRPSNDFFGNILEDPRTGESRNLPFMEMVIDGIVLLNAGSDTTASALTSGIYFLMKTPDALAKLRQEVDQALPPDTMLAPYNLVKDLRYLRACIDETLRLRPPIAYGLQRQVTAPEGITIAGRHFKQGTTVAVPTFAVHRREDLYVDAERYNPDRWLDTSNPQQIKNLVDFTIPFSQGPRACLGRNIAIVEQQILISTLVHRYDFEFVHPEQELKIFERFNSNPGPMPVRVSRRVRS
ncbi:cytochrome P450 [Rhizodiscina lignyota]|uniref:Cytochrome P450 n=1 Tax=Rhizodiscina lignyota TaxID=1504668 RepID=A0A9P4I3B6_9PEZI|nr:cytochrome P450 [Rhizodiscina lignyota]